MGAVACIEERGRLTNLALGVPAGLFTVLAAGLYTIYLHFFCILLIFET